MTLQEWEKLSSIKSDSVKTSSFVVVDIENPHRKELWNLSDYAVTSASASVVWLVPRKVVKLPCVYWHVWLHTDERSSSCLVRYDADLLKVKASDIEVIKDIANKILYFAPEDPVEVAPLPDLKNEEAWHLTNLYLKDV